MVHDGVMVGDSAARVKIIEFSDLECPVCRRFQQTVRVVQAKYPKDVAVVFVHFPLPMHRFARPAARAGECAGNQFAAFVNLVYRKQDSLGLKPWTSYATEAGIRDTVPFAACVHATDPVPRIESGVALGLRMGIRGTPTIIVNGWRLQATPSEEELMRTVDALIAGKEPFPADARRMAQ